MSENATNQTQETKKGGVIGIVCGIIALVVIIAGMIGLYFLLKPAPVQGSKAVVIEVVDDKGETTTYDFRTDEEYLRGAFRDAEGLTVEGDESEYGLYIKTVNGVTADYDVDQSYWSIMVNGEYGQYGADAQPVTDGDKFGLVYTK